MPRLCVGEFYNNIKGTFGQKTLIIIIEVTDGRVVRAGVSETWNVLSWSGGHEYELGQVELGVRSTSVLIRTWTKNIIRWYSALQIFP